MMQAHQPLQVGGFDVVLHEEPLSGVKVVRPTSTLPETGRANPDPL
jgi:hypothetical protein